MVKWVLGLQVKAVVCKNFQTLVAYIDMTNSVSNVGTGGHWGHVSLQDFAINEKVP